MRRLQAEGCGNLVVRARSELDLRDQAAVADFFASERPEYVFLAAAKVGGIHANEAYPADFIRDNLQIQLNVIDSACRHGTRKLLLLGSSCIYPRLAPQPMGESSLLTGALEPTNQWYAVAKIAAVKLCEAYRRHHGFDAISAMPTNLYGPGDNFDLLNSHVMSALLRHMHEAKLRRERTLAVWGTGTSRRKFLHVDTTLRTRASSSCVATTGRSPSISGGERMCRSGNWLNWCARLWGSGELQFDASRADGAPCKLLDVQRMTKLGWSPRISQERGPRIDVPLVCRPIRASAEGIARECTARASRAGGG